MPILKNASGSLTLKIFLFVGNFQDNKEDTRQFQIFTQPDFIYNSEIIKMHFKIRIIFIYGVILRISSKAFQESQKCGTDSCPGM